MIKKYVKNDYILNLRPTVPTKKAELSLVLNYREVLKYIEKNYKDGVFCILESDVFPTKNITNIGEFYIPSSVARRPSSVVRRPSSAVRRPPSVVRRPLPDVRHPSSVV